MVAYTSPDCLPFFECTDSPCLNTGTECEPSTVFCDLTALLDAKFLAFETTTLRTSVAIPIFKVARTAQQIIDTNIAGVSDQIEWDTVLADNENMVNLDVDPTVARIDRAGLWQFELYLFGFPPQTSGNILIAALDNGGTTGFGSDSAMWRTGQSAYTRLSFGREITQASLDSTGPFTVGASASFTGTTGNGLITIEYAELTGFWFGEEVP